MREQIRSAAEVLFREHNAEVQPFEPAGIRRALQRIERERARLHAASASLTRAHDMLLSRLDINRDAR